MQEITKVAATITYKRTVNEKTKVPTITHTATCKDFDIEFTGADHHPVYNTLKSGIIQALKEKGVTDYEIIIKTNLFTDKIPSPAVAAARRKAMTEAAEATEEKKDA